MADDGSGSDASELVSEDATRKGCTWQLLLLVLVALVVLLYIVMFLISGTHMRFVH